MFEEADKALDQALSAQSEAQANAPTNEAPQDTKQPDIPDLGSLERFKYDGREWTPGELKSAMMMQADYTRKTQEIAEERKYYENLSADLKAVRENPSLAEEFKRVYPEKYHSYLDFAQQAQAQAMQHQGNQQQNAQTQPQANIPKEYLEKLNKLETAWSQQEVEKAQAQLDTIFSKFSQKYEMADERTVIAMAQQLHASGTKLDEATWERIFKDDQARNQQRYEQFYKSQINKQTEANRKAKDAGSGGGTPGQAPVKRTFDEATRVAIQELSGRG